MLLRFVFPSAQILLLNDLWQISKEIYQTNTNPRLSSLLVFVVFTSIYKTIRLMARFNKKEKVQNDSIGNLFSLIIQKRVVSYAETLLYSFSKATLFLLFDLFCLFVIYAKIFFLFKEEYRNLPSIYSWFDGKKNRKLGELSQMFIQLERKKVTTVNCKFSSFHKKNSKIKNWKFSDYSNY